jgi:hypothetical protein
LARGNDLQRFHNIPLTQSACLSDTPPSRYEPLDYFTAYVLLMEHVEQDVPYLIGKAGLKIMNDEFVRQSGYPSRVLVARKNRSDLSHRELSDGQRVNSV